MNILRALLVGVLVGLIGGIALALVSALVPGLTINASAWGLVLGVLAFLFALLGDFDLRR